jgi:hypothetical protein
MKQNLRNIADERGLETDIHLNVFIVNEIGQRPSCAVFPQDHQFDSAVVAAHAEERVEIVVRYLFHLSEFRPELTQALLALKC